MNKDAILATIIGFGIGLLITSALLFGPSLAHNLPSLHLSVPQIHWPMGLAKNTNQAKPKPTSTPTSTNQLIESPLPDTFADQSTLLVSGHAPASDTVVIGGPVDEAVVLTKSDGKYADKVSLVEGKNDITVTAMKDGKPNSQTVTVYYTIEDF